MLVLMWYIEYYVQIVHTKLHYHEERSRRRFYWAISVCSHCPMPSREPSQCIIVNRNAAVEWCLRCLRCLREPPSPLSPPVSWVRNSRLLSLTSQLTSWTRLRRQPASLDVTASGFVSPNRRLCLSSVCRQQSNAALTTCVNGHGGPSAQESVLWIGAGKANLPRLFWLAMLTTRMWVLWSGTATVM